MCKKLLLDDAAEYCDSCKGQSASSASFADADKNTPDLSAADADALASATLRLGILGLSFSHLPFFSVPGFVLSLLACARARRYERELGALSGRAKVGSVLGKLGRALGLTWNIIIAVYLTIGMAAGL
jgi:hypothetical protein